VSPLSNPPKTLESPEQILSATGAFMRSRIILTAFELGVFSALGETGGTTAQVAEAVGADQRAVNRLLNALGALGLVTKREGMFFNAPLAARCLIQGRPEYLAGLGHQLTLWDAWGTLTEAVRQGRFQPQAMTNTGRDDVRGFIALMDHHARDLSPEVVGFLDLSWVERVLDLGGGSGAYAVAFLRAKEGIKVTVFDRPEVIPLTQEYLNREGLAGRVETMAGDFLKDEIGTGFDLALLSAIIHANSPEENRALLDRAAKALKPGGQVVVRDFIMDEERLAPETGAIFALNMLVNTPGGDTYTETEIRAWLDAAGLVNIERIVTGFGADLLIGRKPVPA